MRKVYKKVFNNGTFKRVVAKSSMFDIAIGLAIAGVFVNLVNVFVIYILTPPIGSLIGDMTLANFQVDIKILPGHEPVTIRYGIFLDALVQFLLVGIIVYWAARLVLRVKLKGSETKNCSDCAMSVPQKASKCPYCSFQFGTKKDS